jgi:hypothetical protein
MRNFLALAWIGLIAPVVAGGEPTSAAPAVENLLSAESAIYFRYDGYEPHKNAYERTALGKAMKDDLGEFLEYLAFFLVDNIAPLLPEKNPGDLQKLTGGWKHLLEYGWRHGLAAGVEINRVPAGVGALPLAALPFLDVPARVRLTVVFPEGGAGKNMDALLPLLNVLAGEVGRPAGARIIHERTDNDFRAAWWQEGRHVVLVLGNDAIDGPLAVADGRRPTLAASPMLRNLTSFKDYETDIRGFVNVRKLVDLVRGPSDNPSKLAMAADWLARGVVLNQLGLTSVSGLSFHLGFERQYQRSTVVLEVVEPARRGGLARLITAPVRFEPAALPPLPPDAASVRVGHVDWRTIHDLTRPIAWLLNLQYGLEKAKSPEATALWDLGVDIPKEILPYLDSTWVLYNSLSEGPFFLGQGVALKVKDEKKLAEGLDKLMRGLADKTGGSIKKQTYRGVDMTLYSLPIPGLPVAPTLTIHKGWLVVGALPQPVKGYILRSEGKHKVWEPPALVAEALAKNKRQSKLAAVTVTDPRPTVAVGLSLLPALARSLGATGVELDVAKIPNAQAVTEWQFPGVTLLYDDGRALRWETHSAFEVPGDWMLFVLATYLSAF